ncbi:MAG: 4'-phosphopantetheinyl transferase superfamily protein [Methylococcaceae bacterium]|nr:4'-phosphopantetheinyl transferase superfamily protein [Methylococcaceae bacterium]
MTANFVDVWHGEVLPVEPDEQNYYLFLNKTEKQKAASFIRPELQQKYIKTRGLLRKVLGSYLNIKPQKISIKVAEYGKPFIEEKEVFFNLSHTANKFVLAVSNTGEIGIDLEQYKKRKNLLGLVKKCFSELEQDYWMGLSESQKTMLFYRLWVRKEAFVKAVGRGIAVGLNQCVVNPDDLTRFLTIPIDYGLVEDWKIVDVQLTKEDVCAMVIKDIEFTYKQIELK